MIKRKQDTKGATENCGEKNWQHHDEKTSPQNTTQITYANFIKNHGVSSEV